MNIPKDTLGLVAAFTVSGVTHLVRPETFEPLMPAWLPAHREVILASGVAELVCAAGILHPRTRKAAGWASAALLVAVFPGNVTMAAERAEDPQHDVQAHHPGPAPPAAAPDPRRPQGRPRLTHRPAVTR